MTAGPSDRATTGGATWPESKSQEGQGERGQRDDSALTLREQGRSFVSIARTLGLGGAAQANAAFNRALRRLPADEQETLRSHEMARLDALGERLSQRNDLDEAEMVRRTKALDRLRRSLTA